MVAVFSDTSTNNSQAKAFEALGHTVIRYNYRVRAKKLGAGKRDHEIIGICKTEKPDLVFFSKCNTVNIKVVHECNKISETCFWYMDPLNANWNSEAKEKVKHASFSCFDKNNVFKQAKKINKKSYLVREGFDSFKDLPRQLEQNIDVSFIGNLKGVRKKAHSLINFHVFTDAYGEKHSEIVSKSKINLNFCSNRGASDRIYKVLAAGGFLLSDDWDGREELFQDREHLVIFSNLEDLEEKIKFYLDNSFERKRIAQNGYIKVQEYSRINFAKQIIDLHKKVKNEKNLNIRKN